VPYTTSLDDIANFNRGWARQVDEALFGTGAGGRSVAVVAPAPRRPNAPAE
jgi:hypothetical protein